MCSYLNYIPVWEYVSGWMCTWNIRTENFSSFLMSVFLLQSFSFNFKWLTSYQEANNCIFTSGIVGHIQYTNTDSLIHINNDFSMYWCVCCAHEKLFYFCKILPNCLLIFVCFVVGDDGGLFIWLNFANTKWFKFLLLDNINILI